MVTTYSMQTSDDAAGALTLITQSRPEVAMTTYECTGNCEETFSTLDEPDTCPFCGDAEVQEHDYVPKTSRI